MGNSLKLLINKRRRYIVSKKSTRLELSDGVIDVTKAKCGKDIKTHLGNLYHVIKPTWLDRLIMQGKRGPQVILPKDAGAIIANTGINRKSICVDAGAGSGWLACQLANIAKKVTTYENRPEHAKVARANFKELKLKNIKLKEKDASNGFDEKKVDLITLDMLNPEKVPFAKSLKLGGYCVVYLPHFAQVKQFAKSLSSDLIIERILDVKQDNFLPNGKRLKSIRHTAYLVFVRKVSES